MDSVQLLFFATQGGTHLCSSTTMAHPRLNTCPRKRRRYARRRRGNDDICRCAHGAPLLHLGQRPQRPPPTPHRLGLPHQPRRSHRPPSRRPMSTGGELASRATLGGGGATTAPLRPSFLHQWCHRRHPPPPPSAAGGWPSAGAHGEAAPTVLDAGGARQRSGPEAITQQWQRPTAPAALRRRRRFRGGSGLGSTLTTPPFPHFTVWALAGRSPAAGAGASFLFLYFFKKIYRNIFLI